MYHLSRLHILLMSIPIAVTPFYNGAATAFCSEPKEHATDTDRITALQQEFEQGNRLYEAGLTAKAADLYGQLIASLESFEKADAQTAKLLMEVRFNLSQVLLAQGNIEAAASLLKKNVDEDPLISQQIADLRKNSLFHFALTQKQLKNYTEAKRSLDAYLLLPPPLDKKDEASFELGLIDYLSENLSEAKQAFESYLPEESKGQLKSLAQLYLARILLAEGKNNEAALLLDKLEGKVKKDDPLHLEIAFMQGESAFRLHNYQKAITYYRNSLPTTNPDTSPWVNTALYMQGLGYMRLAESPGKKRDELAAFYQQAEESLKKMSDASLSEEKYLALAQCYLARVSRLKQTVYYAKAEEILSQENLFTTTEGKTHALLLRAEAAPSHAIRSKYYKQLTKPDNKETSLYARGWYMRALNDFEQGIALVKKGDTAEGQKFLDEAASAFRETFELTKGKESTLSGEALKLEAVALGYANTPSGNAKASSILNELMNDYPEEWKKMKAPNEVLYLHGYYSGRLATGVNKNEALATAASSLLAAAEEKNDRFADQALKHLAALYFDTGAYADAEATYLRLAESFPNSQYGTEAWVWAARCAELLGKGPEVAKERRKNAYEKGDAASPYAAEAYFTLYSYQDYLQGDRSAIRHLQGLAAKYPESPFLIEAYYLIGLDNKRDRKNDEGRWIRKRSLTDAIDAFQKSEILFDDLAAKKLIPPDKIDYYTAMRYRATFERAMANLAIANDAQAAKRQIYLDYAEEVFENLLADLDDKKNPQIRELQKKDPEFSLREECSFWLAQTYIKGGKESEAEQILKGISDGYKKSGTTRSYYLSRTLGEQGLMAMRRNDFRGALLLLKAAEEAGKGGILSTDQRLDLSIQQSLCCRNIGQYDDAILILSKVINDDAVSSLRVKAMYLRAETYELQGRPELAKKQLESMVKKGGVWARKAQEKLEKEYLNHGK